jgi:hypothetical protein
MLYLIIYLNGVLVFTLLLAAYSLARRKNDQLPLLALMLISTAWPQWATMVLLLAVGVVNDDMRLQVPTWLRRKKKVEKISVTQKPRALAMLSRLRPAK